MYKRQDKKTLKYTVTESVEGLGILGKIIMDSDITEVMINGYDTIFVEKSGKLMQLEEHFESSEDLERIVKRFVSSMDRTVDASNPKMCIRDRPCHLRRYGVCHVPDHRREVYDFRGDQGLHTSVYRDSVIKGYPADRKDRFRT